MLRNVCGAEQRKRFIIGLVLMNIGLFLSGWIVAAGFLIIQTALAAYCPINHLIKRNSCSVKHT